MDADGNDLAGAVTGIVGTTAWTVDDIRSALAERGFDLGDDSDGDGDSQGFGGGDRLDELLRDDLSFADTVDGSIISVPNLIDGTTWTTWVDGNEVAAGFVSINPYLTPLGWWLVDREVALVDGDGNSLGNLELTDHEVGDRVVDVLVGPEGWLDGLGEGWVAVTIRGATSRLAPCDQPPPATDAQLAAVRAGFDRATRIETTHRIETDEHVELAFAAGDDTIYEAMLTDRAAFTADPIPPKPALYEAAGLETDGSVVVEQGFDWDSLRTWQIHNRLRSTHRLSDRRTELLVVLLGASRTVADGDADALGTTDDERDGAAALMMAILEDGETAAAYWNEQDRRDVPNAARRRFADALVARAGSATDPSESMGLPVGLAWLRASIDDRDGDVATAIATLEASVTADSEHSPALIALAGFAADRSDARTAYRLLERAGLIREPDQSADEQDERDDAYSEQPDDVRLLVDAVSAFGRERPRPTAKRNDPCPCGSGKKYKACHLGRELLPFEDRAAWLHLKAQRFLRSHHPFAVDDLADVFTEDAGSDLSWQLRDSPFIADLLLRDGVFDEFVASRGALLPDDEAELATTWRDAPTAVFEVERARTDWIVLRNLDTDEHVTIANVQAGGRMAPGSHVVGRPLPVGDDHRAFGGFMPVAGGDIERLVDVLAGGSATDIAVALGQRLTRGADRP